MTRDRNSKLIKNLIYFLTTIKYPKQSRFPSIGMPYEGIVDALHFGTPIIFLSNMSY
jgi:hypothetical protein